MGISNWKPNIKQRLVNLTPHAVNVLDADNNEMFTVPSEGCARVRTISKHVMTVNDVTVNSCDFLNVEGLPEPQAGVRYLVSRIVALEVFASDDPRGDLLVPADLVRNERGHIIGCRTFDRIGF